MTTDEELVARSRGGDLDSFNQLVLRWERPIYALAYRVIGREEEARDIAQETFLRAFRALKGFKGQAKFSSWLYRITLNLCRDWMRRERRTPIAQTPEGVDLVELAGEATPWESIEDLVSRKELGRAVAKAMSVLPEEQRTAIALATARPSSLRETRSSTDSHGVASPASSTRSTPSGATAIGVRFSRRIQSRHRFNVIRYNHDENFACPLNPFSARKARRNVSWATSRASSSRPMTRYARA